MKLTIAIAALLCLLPTLAKSQTGSDPSDYATISSDRPDGRFISSYAISRQLVKEMRPSCEYRENMNASEFSAWQDSVREGMRRIMKFPTNVEPQPAPAMISSEQRDGYTLEKWEFYPLPDAVSTFLVLKPDGMTKPAPAVLCIPGSGQTKEQLAGEPGIHPSISGNYTDPKVQMAVNMVRQGYIAVAVDNPGAGECGDLERYGLAKGYDYETMSRMLLEVGWNWLGFASYLDQQVLDWMKTQPQIRHDRIVVSGFSLGTEPMMVLGVLNPDIYAFVYNDFLCNTQERAVVLCKPRAETGRRPFPNSIRHLIPDYWQYFNFPDVAASLAPRPIIFTEGGMDRDFRKIQSAYKTAGAPDNVECHHYPKFQNPADRNDVEHLDEGMSAQEFFKAANVDPPSHYFKSELIMPWLQRMIKP